MKQILLLLLIFSFVTSCGQNEAIDKANKLIDAKQYESAIKVLNEADPGNNDPDMVIAKTDLFLNYFVSSIMHQIFALKDLEENEELLDIRGSEGSFSMYTFAPDSVLNRLIEKYPKNYDLHKSLGNFYHEVHLKYGQDWIQSDSVVVNKFFNQYKLAYDHGVVDYWSAYGMGYASLLMNDYEQATIYLEKSTSLKDDYASSHYNLAYAYLYTGQREKGIESAKDALELYDYPRYKADAARMIAVVYRELEQDEKAWEYLVLADEQQPDDYNTLKYMLEVGIALSKASYKEQTKDFFLIAPENPTIYQDLLNAYFDNNKTHELISFFESQHTTYQDDHKVNGNLYFYTAKVQFDQKDYPNAKVNFAKSAEIFRKVYPPNHQVFSVIESYNYELKDI